MKTLDDAPFLDLFSPDFQADPETFVRDIRASSWLARTPIGAVALGRPQVQVLLSDRRLRSSLTELVQLQGISDGPLFDSISRSILAVDGEDHLRLRKLVNRAFTPKAVDRHRDEMRTVLTRLVAPVVPAGRCDFMAAIAEHYPIEVMCHLLGVPTEDHERFAQWNRSITWVLSLELWSHMDEVQTAMGNLRAYVADLTDERRRHPKDDLVTEMVQAEESGDRLTDDEIQMMIAGLLFAGYDTTRNQLGLAMAAFAERPEQWKLLADDPSLAAPAVEEIMRFRGAVGMAPRVVIEDLELDGYRIPAGTMLALSTSAANHDPTAYDRPDELDITVDREPQLTFGGGPHYCLGASLARAEMQEALPILARAMPGLTLDGEPTWRPPMGIFGPETLPIKFAAG
ncbi:MAG: cytochrome P450 [Acidimicrobiales bacterium]